MPQGLDPVQEALLNATIAAQAVAFAAQDIVRELILDVARLYPDPNRYTAELYDRVARNLDPTATELQKGEKKAFGLARDIVEGIFVTAAKRLRTVPDQDHT